MKLHTHIAAIVASLVLIPVVNPTTFDGAAILWGNLFLQIYFASLHCQSELDDQDKKHPQP